MVAQAPGMHSSGSSSQESAPVRTTGNYIGSGQYREGLWESSVAKAVGVHGDAMGYWRPMS